MFIGFDSKSLITINIYSVNNYYVVFCPHTLGDWVKISKRKSNDHDFPWV